MATVKLTKTAVERARPEGKRTLLWDSVVRGFGVRVTPTTRTYFVRYRRGQGRAGTQVDYTIGRHGQPWTVDKARDEAQRVLRLVAQGHDPQAERRGSDDNAERTFGELAHLFLERHVDRNLRASTAEGYRDIIHRELIPAWGLQPVTAVDRAAVLDLLDGIEDRAPATARLTFSIVRRLFGFALERGIVERNPCDGLRGPAVPKARDRVLSETEIRWLWHAAGEIGWPYGPATRFLLLTAQRKSEVSGMTWGEVAWRDAVWTIPADRTKTERAHAVDLSPQAVEILADAPLLGADSERAAADDWVFTVDGTRGLRGWSNAKKRLDAAMARQAEAEGAPPPEPWRIHDLRRTAATGMAGIGYSPHVVERVLNHTSGATGGIVAVYQHHEYRAERRAALDAWGRRVVQLAEGADAADDNVVALTR